MIKYPRLRVITSPTPSEHLVICEVCHKAKWTIKVQGGTYYCCNTRQREATTAEYEIGKSKLK